MASALVSVDLHRLAGLDHEPADVIAHLLEHGADRDRLHALVAQVAAHRGGGQVRQRRGRRIRRRAGRRRRCRRPPGAQAERIERVHRLRDRCTRRSDLADALPLLARARVASAVRKKLAARAASSLHRGEVVVRLHLEQTPSRRGCGRASSTARALPRRAPTARSNAASASAAPDRRGCSTAGSRAPPSSGARSAGCSCRAAPIHAVQRRQHLVGVAPAQLDLGAIADAVLGLLQQIEQAPESAAPAMTGGLSSGRPG